MWNEKGISFTETLLTVVILFTIVSSLLPLMHRINTTLYNQKLELHASEVAYEVAKKLTTSTDKKGIKIIEDVVYEWHFDGQAICIEFNNLYEGRKKCIDRNGVGS